MNTYQEKLQRQLELETESVRLGVEKYRKQFLNAKVTDMPPGLALMYRAIAPTEAVIVEFLKPSRGGGRLHDVKQFLADFEPVELAYITARHIINSIATVQPVQRVAISLAEQLLDHLEYKKFREIAPKYLAKVEENLKTNHARHRRTVILRAKRKLGIEDTKWNEQIKLRIGTKLIELFTEATGLVQRVQNERSQWVLIASPEVSEWLERQHARCELLDPVFMPMIVPPIPWDSPFGGGYLSNSETFRVKLVKTANKKYLEELAEHEMPLVYRALNALQNTAWRINRRIYEVLREVQRLDNGLGGIPQDIEEPLPPKPWTTDEEYQTLKAEQPEVVKAWKRQATEVYARRLRNASKRRQLALKLWTAEKFLNEEAIYFVWTLDWRGRMYPVSPFLSPQGDDVSRALLEFSQGKPLGPDGFRWLKINLANKYGMDKVSFDDRLRWVEEHHEDILRSAEDPLGYTWWSDADSPYCFLAACFEYRDAILSGSPETYESHIPIAMDGSCNGLQNFAAMLRDEVGGRAVNLLPMDKPQDVYQEVCDVVSRMVEEDAAKGDETACLWIGKIDRSLVKRNVMTVPYGVSLFGMREQIQDELSKRNGPGERYLDVEDGDDFRPALYLARKVHEAVGQVVIGARKAMDWLQAVAKVASAAGVAIRWTTPSGFLVCQDYRVQKNKDIRTIWGKARIKLSLNFPTEKLDTRKQVNGIAPNFVHSMDASHLVLTVNKALDAGISSFAMIHDSYGTHAADCATLARLLREAFVEMYEQADVLQRFYEEVSSQLPPEAAKQLPSPPEMGNLDLRLVLDSLYFFA